MKSNRPLFILIGIGLIYFALCLIGPKDIFSVNIKKNLKASPEEVFENINNLENWKKWAEWQINAQESELNYSRQTLGKGALLEFDLPKTGKGEIEIIESQKNRFIKTRTFFNNWDGTTYSEYIIEENPDGSSTLDLSVSNSENINFFMRGILFLNNSSDKVYQNTLLGLQNLDALNEKD